VGRKTVTVSFSPAPYEALKEAVKNERALWKIVGEMERLSRRISSKPGNGVRSILLIIQELGLQRSWFGIPTSQHPGYCPACQRRNRLTNRRRAASSANPCRKRRTPCAAAWYFNPFTFPTNSASR
jgi:hypothetical protein